MLPGKARQQRSVVTGFVKGVLICSSFRGDAVYIALPSRIALIK